MAREPTESHTSKHKKDVAADLQAQPKSSKATTSHRQQGKSLAQDMTKLSEATKKASKSKIPSHHPTMQPEGVKKTSKSKKTASAAGVFKRAKHDEKKHRKRKDRVPTPEPTLTEILRDGITEGIEEARTSIDKTLHATFDAQHEEFLRQLAESRAADIKFFELISNAAHSLRQPLRAEQIETTFTRDGKRVTEIVEIGKRIELFKKAIEKDETKLKGLWKEWETLQSDFVELGIEVFGPEVFGQAANDAKVKGSIRDIEAMDKEHDGRIGDLTAEVDSMAEDFLTRMKESEKELDASAKEQQRKLLQALISE